jgi:hypothetical protein
MNIAMPFQKQCGACGLTKSMELDFNRVDNDPRFRKRIWKNCEELLARKFKRPVMTNGSSELLE